LAATSGSRLGTLTFADPQHEPGWTHALVPASDTRELPSAHRDLAVEVVGAGRVRGLSEWLDETSSTSLVVVADGAVVHEWYAEGHGPDTLFLGASMTKSVLAHVVGLQAAPPNDHHRQMYMVCRVISSGVATRRMTKHPGGAKYGLGLDVPCCQATV